MTFAALEDARCQCCRATASQACALGRVLTLTWASNGDLTSLCDFCEGLINAGLVRPETVDGELRYRQWIMEWKPGKLVGGEQPA